MSSSLPNAGAGYDTGRAQQESPYSYPTPQYIHEPSFSSAATPDYHDASQMSSMAYSSNPSRSQFNETSGPYMAVSSSIPEVVSYAPRQGTGGARMLVNITSLYEFIPSNLPVFFIFFGSRRCPAQLAKSSPQQGAAQYSVTADIPPFASTGSSSANVTVSMVLEYADGEPLGRVNVGSFLYVDGHGSGSSTLLGNMGDGKVSPAPSDLLARSEKCQLPQKDSLTSYGYPSTDSNPYSSYLVPSSSFGTVMTQYNRPESLFPPQNSSRQMAYGYTNDTLPTIKAEAQSPSCYPGYSGYANSAMQSSGLSSNAPYSRAHTSLPSPSTPNPPLVRTTLLQKMPTRTTATPQGNEARSRHINPFYPRKAELHIKGELRTMTNNWTEDEVKCRRRLVLFKRSQSGSMITTTFSRVSPEDRPQNSICVSCIYWEGEGNYYITSVEVISLLEKLVATRFDVEEKNRIRRNLEGLKPVTVHKQGSANSEDFFKLIMGFPNPKPRNIEKNVKVFKWDDLANALHKIFSRYCERPPSVMPPGPGLLTPISSSGYATESSSAGLSYANDHHGAISPRSLASNTSTAYNHNIPPRVLSPDDHKAMGLHGGPPDLRLSLTQTQDASNQWQGNQHHMLNAQAPYPHYGGAAGGQQSRGSWDMSSYLESSPHSASAAGTSSNTFHGQSSQSSHGQGQSHHQQQQHLSEAAAPVGSHGENRNMGPLALSKQHESQPMPLS
ncbi:hypothetical protein BP6252_08557 [Coleophoma cylindrospora]|uniref:DUF7082 domain-containing protein n=1 Tax=Coleophoma cylindrospora TaxID=1849047 RepID=A0A3D8R6B3_9HELO|nr:hypothetical protein BP6252_08557 [Coleophoma cylindrospora]